MNIDCLINSKNNDGKEVLKLNISEYARLIGCSWKTAKKRILGTAPKQKKRDCIHN